MSNPFHNGLFWWDKDHLSAVIDDTKCTLYVQSEKKPTLSTKKVMLAKCISEFCKLHADDVHRYVMDTVDSTKARRYNEEVGFWFHIYWILSTFFIAYC